MRYRFTHIYPEVFAHLSHGVDAVVHRATEGSHYSDPVVSAPGSTVVLEPGDDLETTAAQDHPHLQPVDDDAKNAVIAPALAAVEQAASDGSDALAVMKTAAEGAKNAAPTPPEPAESNPGTSSEPSSEPEVPSDADIPADTTGASE